MPVNTEREPARSKYTPGSAENGTISTDARGLPHHMHGQNTGMPGQNMAHAESTEQRAEAQQNAQNH